MKDSGSGSKQYAESHVKGALFWDLGKHLSDMVSGGGRHPMPTKEQLAELIQESGLTPGDSVIVYDQGGAPFAARAWWLLKYAGFENAYISKRGFEALKADGIEVSADVPKFPRTDAPLAFDESLYADRSYVKGIIEGEELAVLLDARSAKRYAGIEEPIDPVAGRIPGARNFDWEQLIKNHQFKEDIDFSDVLQKQEPAVVYCGSGVSAAALFAALSESGYESVRLYVGSFSDWIADSSNVVEIDSLEQPEAETEDAKAILARLIEEGYSGEMLMKKFEYEKSLLAKE